VFQEYSAIFQPASDFLYTGYIADTVWIDTLHKSQKN
jgi:hypothetical protein